MNDTIAHRGPDGSGVWIDGTGRVGMAHRRLAIIDLSAAASQPMHDSSGELTIVYNGEIYNHAEVRAHLTRLGHRSWQTDHSDTEVILMAFRQWGIDCLKHFTGMFAFALWDSRTNDLWLIRDRIGVKPIYYSTYGGRLAFASEIKALLADPDCNRSVNEEALFHYLTFLASPAPLTLFNGINKLPPGHWLRIRHTGSIEMHRWWDVWDQASPLPTQRPDEIADMLLASLRRSVSYRKVADRPAGVFLSGGIDSGINAALFAEGETESIKTFTIGYEGNNPSYVNETDQARETAAFVGSDHCDLFLNSKHVLDFLPRMIHHQDEPLADPVCIPVFYVSKLARENGVVVCQVGEGADELFHGYRSWRALRMIQTWSDRLSSVPLGQMALGMLGLLPLLPDHRLEYFRQGGLGHPVFMSGATVFTDRLKHRLLAPDVKSRLSSLTSWDAVQTSHKRFMDNAWEKTATNWMSYADLTFRLPELLLMRVDKMSMAVSLEARVPFLDHEFVSLAMSIPSNIKLEGKVSKAILKRASKNLLPSHVIHGPKRGFGMPMRDWLWNLILPEVRSSITRFSERSGLVRGKEVERIIASKDVDQTWVLLNLALWWEQHFGN